MTGSLHFSSNLKIISMLQVSISLKFYKDLQEHGADEVGNTRLRGLKIFSCSSQMNIPGKYQVFHSLTQ